MKLERKLTEVQSFSQTQTETVRTLEQKFEAEMITEERDPHDPASVAQQVEQSLELMTKRAVTAGNRVMELKRDTSLLQAQVSTFKREQEALRSAGRAPAGLVWAGHRGAFRTSAWSGTTRTPPQSRWIWSSNPEPCC